MAQEDIYGNKARYERFKANLKDFCNKPLNGKYYCKNPQNLTYFEKLFNKFESEDVSYIRRNRLIAVLKQIVSYTNKNLKDCSRNDIDQVTIEANKNLNPKSFSDFKKDIKHIWATILPEKDEKGRTDETIIPYVVRHLKTHVDKSKQQARKDRFSWTEFQKIIEYFSNKPNIQSYLMVAFETLARPQELLWRKIKDLELHDNFAKIYLTDHGKEGIGLLGVIESFAYLTDWLNQHPEKNNPEAWLFQNQHGEQLTPPSINKQIKKACEHLKITKPFTCYSLKRNGVTHRRLRGDKDVEIQHAARWTSTKQLKTYDLSEQEDAFKLQLIKAGKINPDENFKHFLPKEKTCVFCKSINKFTDATCSNCRRPLDREKVAQLEREKEIKALNEFMSIPQIQELFKTVYELKRTMEREKR